MKTTAILLACLALCGPLVAQVLLISDQQGFRTLAGELRAEGYDVTLREEEYDNGYANLLDSGFLNGFEVVVYSETGDASTGSVIPTTVATALTDYVESGGHLLLTGIDVFAHPADGAMATLAGSTSTADYFVSVDTWVVPDIDHPVLNGPYGDFRGQTFTGINFRDFSGDYDTAEPDTAAGTIELAALGDPRGTGKLLFTDYPAPGGSTAFWNGGTADPNVDPQDELLAGTETGGIFRNYLAATDGLPATLGSRLLVTEILANPNQGGNADGQYIELFNAGPLSVDLDGWTIRKLSPSSASHTISGPLVVPPGSFALLGTSSDLGGTLRSGKTVDHVYTSVDYIFGGNGLQVMDDQNVEVDRVNFDFTTFYGVESSDGVAAVFPGGVNDDNADAPAWTLATVSEPNYDSGVVDFGSPGTRGVDQGTVVAVPPSYYVTFDLGELGTLTGGEVIQTVPAGSSAVAPTFEVEPGWTFTGWNLDFSSVTGPIQVAALYEVETYTLTFDVGLHGTRTGGGALSQVVSASSPAQAPQITSDPGWRFVGWDTDFTTVLGDLTITALYELGPSAVAGGDVEIIDETGDDQVMVRLDGGGSRPATGEISSWEWTWSGGSASGEVVDVVFPATNLPVTVTLTVTDGAAEMASDTLDLTVFTRESGLYKDFAGFDTDPFASFIDRALLAGDTLLVDGTDAANEKVYRFTGGSWVESPLPSSGPDHALVDADTIVSGDFTNLTDFALVSWNGSSWSSSPITVSGSLPAVDGEEKTLRFTADTVVIGDGNSDATAADGGQVFVYDWSGTTWTNTGELLPPGGLVAGNRYGDFLAIEGDLIVVSRKFDLFGGSSYPRARLDLFRRSGAVWSFDESLLYDPEVPTSVSGFALEPIDLKGGVILSRSVAPNTFVLVEEVASAWEQTEFPYDIAEYGFGFDGIGGQLDSDGGALLTWSGNGVFELHVRDEAATDWTGYSGTARRPLVDDLNFNSRTKVTDFDSGRLAVVDGAAGTVRVFMEGSTGPEPFAIEATANAGPDIATTSFDGQPVRVFLNGGASFHPDGAESLNARWIWDGGSVNGLQAFADIDPSVTSVELVLTDGRGGVAKDTANVSIIQPPVIDAGADVTVADTDGDGTIRLKVSGAVISQDADIASWTWRWTGGVFSGQSGTITLTEAARSQPVTLEVTDENGLTRVTSFDFDLLDPNPVPDILEPTDGASGDQFGAAVAIDGGVALVGASEKTTEGLVLGASYLHENITDEWQQIQLPATEVRQGQSVEVSGDWAFVGAPPYFTNPGNSSGLVKVYRRVNGNWTAHSTLVPVDPSTGFPRSGSNDRDEGFGASMAVDGDTLVVGSPESTLDRGRVFVFQLIDGAWVQVGEIDPPAGDDVSYFGSSVAVHGSRVAIGAGGYSNLNSGVAYAYEDGPSGWTFQARFESDNVSNPAITGSDRYGYAVAMNDSEILVGASLDDEDDFTGAVYRYSLSGGTWSRTGKLSEPAGGFGSSLALLGDTLAVAASADNTPGFNGTRGSVTTFHLRDGEWEKSGYLPMSRIVDPTIPETLVLGFLEATLDHDGTDLIVGGFDQNQVMVGKAYIYRNFAGLAAEVNFEPRADAGGEINVTDTFERGPAPDYLITEPLGSEEVTLDGSASSDEESAIVSYEWTWNGGSASGMMPTVRFPVGVTTATLTVTDEFGVENRDTVDVTVTLPQTPPDPLPSTTGNTLTVNLPVPDARWRLSSEFLWHGDGETIGDIVAGESYQLEIIAYPGSDEVLTTVVEPTGGAYEFTFNGVLDLPASATGVLRFPETAQGFSWRLSGEEAWRNVTDNGDEVEDLIDFTLPVGDYRIEFRPVAGYATPRSRVVPVRQGIILGLNWGDYLLISNFNPARTFDLAGSPDLEGDPYQYVGMIRSSLGRGTGTVVSERVVLTAAHLFFDFNGLSFAETQWFARQQQGERQAPPMTPRGILYQTSYAKLVAPDSIDGSVPDLPEDPQEVDFAALYFTDAATWTGGSANFLESNADKNWLTGTENKHALGYAQRSQVWPQRGMIFEKLFAAPLTAIDDNVPAKLYETNQVFGEGGCSGGPLMVEVPGSGQWYPAGILLAGQSRAVYRVIDGPVTRMIKDAQDASTGNDDVLDSSSSLVSFDSLGAFTTLSVSVAPSETLSAARWSVTPNAGSGYANVSSGQSVPFNAQWDSFTLNFGAVSGYATPEPIVVDAALVTAGADNSFAVTYEPLSGFDDWKLLNLVPSSDADDDADGLIALVEYALDLDPDQPDYRAAIRVKEDPSQSTHLELEVYVSAVADAIRYEVELADTLADFVTGTNVLTAATFTKADGSSDYRVVTDPQAMSATTTRFARVVITHDRSLSTAP